MWPDRPATVTVECLGVRHRLVVHRGRLTVCDHEDREAEQILGALGAEAPRCLVIAAGWDGEWSDAELIGGRPSLAPRIWTTVVPGGVSYASVQTPPYPGATWTVDREPEELQRWLVRRRAAAAMPPHVRALHAACLTASGSVTTERWDPALRRRLDEGLGDGLREVLGRPDAFVASVIVPIGAVEANGIVNDEVAVLSPFVYRSWPARVGDRGLTVVDGALVLDARPARDGRTEEVCVVAWEPSDVGLQPTVVTRTLERTPGGWRLRSSP